MKTVPIKNVDLSNPKLVQVKFTPNKKEFRLVGYDKIGNPVQTKLYSVSTKKNSIYMKLIASRNKKLVKAARARARPKPERLRDVRLGVLQRNNELRSARILPYESPGDIEVARQMARQRTIPAPIIPVPNFPPAPGSPPFPPPPRGPPSSRKSKPTPRTPVEKDLDEIREMKKKIDTGKVTKEERDMMIKRTTYLQDKYEKMSRPAVSPMFNLAIPEEFPTLSKTPIPKEVVENHVDTLTRDYDNQMALLQERLEKMDESHWRMVATLENAGRDSNRAGAIENTIRKSKDDMAAIATQMKTLTKKYTATMQRIRKTHTFLDYGPPIKMAEIDAAEDMDEGEMLLNEGKETDSVPTGDILSEVLVNDFPTMLPVGLDANNELHTPAVVDGMVKKIPLKQEVKTFSNGERRVVLKAPSLGGDQPIVLTPDEEELVAETKEIAGMSTLPPLEEEPISFDPDLIREAAESNSAYAMVNPAQNLVKPYSANTVHSTGIGLESDKDWHRKKQTGANGEHHFPLAMAPGQYIMKPSQLRTIIDNE